MQQSGLRYSKEAFYIKFGACGIWEVSWGPGNFIKKEDYADGTVGKENPCM